MTKTSTKTAGIDTAKHKLDIAVHGQARQWQVTNDASGWQQLAADLMAAGVGRIGIEASGGYESGSVAYLRGAGFTVLLLQPMQVNFYARQMLRRAKNDALDAALIAAFTASYDPRRIVPDARLVKLLGPLTFIEQIEEDIARLKVRLEHTGELRQRQHIDSDIARLKLRRLAELKWLAQQLRQHSDLGRRLDLVLSIPGIGVRTALAIVVRMPELGQVSREEAAALAGLAPFDHDSGKHRGQRHIAGGRDRLRRSLYAAALAASFRWNAALISLYRRLIARKKPHKAALVACARKLIVYANTVVQRGSSWTENLTAL